MLSFFLFIAGLSMTLTGFRVINWSKKPEYEVFYSKWARVLIIAGPMMLLLWLFRVIF